MPLLQPYGIDLAGDLVGLLGLALALALVSHSRRTFWSVACALTALSAAGSITVVWEAVSRGDAAVLAYHAIYIAALIPVAVRTRTVWRPVPSSTRPATQPRSREPLTARGREEQRVHVITTLPPRT